MLRQLAPMLVLFPAVAGAEPIQPGAWDVTSTAVTLVLPGAPAFLTRMLVGKSKTEHKCVTPELAQTGVAALLTPEPKAQCRVASIGIEGGRYAQTLSCPQKAGAPLQLKRAGTYDATGFTGRVELAGQTSRGPLRMTLDQHAARVGATCRG